MLSRFKGPHYTGVIMMNNTQIQTVDLRSGPKVSAWYVSGRIS